MLINRIVRLVQYLFASSVHLLVQTVAAPAMGLRGSRVKPSSFCCSPPEFLCKAIPIHCFKEYILRTKIKIAATDCHILRLKCTKIDFFWGSAPDPDGGAYRAPPDPLAGFKGFYF